jgi:hypothetical protein
VERLWASVLDEGTVSVCEVTELEDADFETISKMTGQPQRWITVRGSVD